MRLFTVLLALLAVAVLPSAALAAPPDLARGHGEVASQPTQFSFAARSDALNTPGTASGHMRLETGAFSAVADVECLVVLGNRATLIGRITQSSGLVFPPFSGRLVFLAEDNQGAPDEFSYVVEMAINPPEPCTPQDPLHPVTKGNILVRDN